MNKDKSVLSLGGGTRESFTMHNCTTAFICKFSKTEAKRWNLCCATLARVELHCPASPSLSSSGEPSFPYLPRAGHFPDLEQL